MSLLIFFILSISFKYQIYGKKSFYIAFNSYIAIKYKNCSKYINRNNNKNLVKF